ncbi:MAG TPA: glutathione S-transferase family protein [Baekduia sp.]|uniref:glutathione S-transferase family protein n=1 Tax=Baekduia sp. TaxID=2600305 RepID=UPI002B8770A1|nr:glutathione S-transferase family protein [Baekduia sp.]HMJ37653.1 glutathione S-transferase family protein [Baekduia sp.]
MRLHAIPHSTNVDRVALALGLKGVALDARVQHDPGDRAGVRAVSGQELVPVLETDDGQVLTDSMAIVAWIDATWPRPHPLYPADPAARREVEAFVAFFDGVWKVAPNAIEAEQARPEPDLAAIAAWAAQLRGWQHGFDALLQGRDHLFGDAPGAADICAYPFLRFATSSDPGDDDLFHGVLLEHLALGAGEHSRLAAWITRMASLPKA